jgi:hypothetical protein
MEIIWASKPDAKLILVLWEYDEGGKHLFGATGRDRVWWWEPNISGFWTLWPGRGQLAALRSHRALEDPPR